MDARQIQDMRALLAAQVEARAPPPSHFIRRQSRGHAHRTQRPSPEPQVGDGGAFLMDDDLSIPPIGCAPRPKLTPTPEPVAPELLLGSLAPRRIAFGQRNEAVLDLLVPAPSASERLTLLGADGAAVGEIVLHTGDAPRFIERRRRKPLEPLHWETPFFPEDLADHPAPRLGRPLFKREPESPPPPELAAAFLLASLAARLAKEEEMLKRQILPSKSGQAA